MRHSWSDWMSARLDCLLDLTADGFLTGAARRYFCEPGELQRGVEGAVEQEEKEEVLGFLIILKYWMIIQIMSYLTCSLQSYSLRVSAVLTKPSCASSCHRLSGVCA